MYIHTKNKLPSRNKWRAKGEWVQVWVCMDGSALMQSTPHPPTGRVVAPSGENPAQRTVGIRPQRGRHPREEGQQPSRTGSGTHPLDGPPAGGRGPESWSSWPYKPSRLHTLGGAGLEEVSVGEVGDMVSGPLLASLHKRKLKESSCCCAALNTNLGAVSKEMLLVFLLMSILEVWTVKFMLRTPRLGSTLHNTSLCCDATHTTLTTSLSWGCLSGFVCVCLQYKCIGQRVKLSQLQKLTTSTKKLALVVCRWKKKNSHPLLHSPSL